MLSVLRPTEFTVKSLTTIATPHRFVVLSLWYIVVLIYLGAQHSQIMSSHISSTPIPHQRHLPLPPQAYSVSSNPSESKLEPSKNSPQQICRNLTNYVQTAPISATSPLVQVSDQRGEVSLEVVIISLSERRERMMGLSV